MNRQELVSPELDTYIIKLGTSAIADVFVDGTEQINPTAIHSIGKQVVKLSENEDKNVIIVSSGAIAAAIGASRPSCTRPTDLKHLQSLSSIGNRLLLNAWEMALPSHLIAQNLITNNELKSDKEKDNILGVLKFQLFSSNKKIIPIINENDVVATEDLTFGDNDILASQLAVCMQQSKSFGKIGLFLLTNVDGVLNEKNELIKVIKNPSDYKFLDSHKSSCGKGGMVSKMQAASTCKSNDIPMWIAHGRTPNCIELAHAGQVGTYIPIY